MTTPKRPRDPNQLAHLIAGIATGEVEDKDPDAGKMAVRVQSGRKGGKKGGVQRAANLTAEQRSEIAKKAAAGRWGKKD